MKYLFILGRNIELSIAEINVVFGKEIISSELKKNGFLVELKNKISENFVDKLGSVIGIGEILGDVKDLDKLNIYSGKKNNFNYVLWNFSNSFGKVQNYLRKRFRSEKLKATEKKMGGTIKSQKGDVLKKTSSKLIDEEYFVFGNYFGKLVQKCDYKKIEERDMKKPVRRESLSISPRLAKIMINLSQVQENEKLVDAFCGIGVILQEALLQKIKVVGIDKDEKAIKGAKENLKWFGFDKSNYEVFNGDSRKFKIGKVSAMVSEPDLGKILRQIPNEKQARKTLREFENLMIDVLNNLKNSVKKRFVFTAPFIKTIKKRIGCNFEKIAEKTGLKLVEGFPIKEFRENQVVGRQIFVFESQ